MLTFCLIRSYFLFLRPKNAQLISESSEVELGEVCLHPDIEQILSDEQWINDASGLMPHCLAILKLCHLLTNRIIALTMANISQHRKHNLENFVLVSENLSSFLITVKFTLCMLIQYLHNVLL